MQGNRQVAGFDRNRPPQRPVQNQRPIKGAAKVEKVVAKNMPNNLEVREVAGTRYLFVATKKGDR